MTEALHVTAAHDTVRRAEIDLDLHRFRRHARSGLVLMALSAALVLGALAYGTAQLNRQQTERQALQAEIVATRAALQTAQDRLAAEQARVQRTRAAFWDLQLGLRQFYVKDYAGAVRHYDAALAIDPDSPVVLDLRGYALLRAGRVAEAVASLERSVALAPDYGWGRYNLSLAYAHAGRPADAVAALAALFAREPERRDTVRGDGQFRVLRDDPGFQALMQR